MRKLIVLVSALLLVSMVAIASDTTFSGEVEQRWANDFNAKAYSQNPVVELKIDVVVDDNSSLYLELEEGTSGLGMGAVFDKAHFTLDLGGIFDLPVGVTVRTGFDEYDQFDAVKVTFGEYEDIIGSDIQAWGHEINVAATEQVAIRVLWANDPGAEYYSAGVAVTYDPIYVEASYVNISSDLAGGVVEDPAKGDIEFGVEFMQEVADGIDVAAAATMDFDLEADASAKEMPLATAGDPYWAYGVAGQVTYNDMATLGLALRGEQESTASSLQVDISATPVEAVTLFLVAGIGLDSDIYADAFESFEGSAMFMIGPSTWYAGLLWSAESAVNVIASEKADFVTEVPDMMAIFMRAELKY
jgi:hypothetical protein